MSLKKLVSLVLCALLVCTLLPSLALAEGETPLRTVKILCTDTFDANWKLKDRESNKCFQAFTEELARRGVQVEYELIDGASLATVIQTRMAAQVDLPDIIADAWSGVSQSEVLNWAENGLLVNIYDAVNQYDDDGSIFKFYEDRCPGALASQTAADGGLYWFSYLNSPTFVEQDGTPFDYPGNPFTLSIREDWLKKAGLEYDVFMTPDELYAALQAIQACDPNGNGVKDEVITIAIDSFSNGLAKGFGLSSNLLGGIDKSTNQIVCNFYEPEFKEYIAYMQKLYGEGLYDTAALGDGVTDQMIADNKSALVYSYCRWTSFEPSISSEPNAVYAPFILDDDAGVNGFGASCDPLFGTYCRYLVTSACKDLEAVVDLFDFIYTDEYALLDFSGIEGYSFAFNEAGIPERLWTSEQEAACWDGVCLFYTVGLYAVPAINTGYVVLDRKLPEDFSKIKIEFHNWWLDNAAGKVTVETSGGLSLPSDEELESINEVENVLTTYAKELLTDLILGRRSLDELDTYIKEMEELGLTDYLDIMQARRDRFVSAVGAN